jgi:methylenetetrahydrofolate dehydrogenase (NADP+)/methenyltetrahydrofolate cyclohydrolase
MLIGDPMFLPATPSGIQELLVRSGNDPDGKHVVIVGRSNIVGKPVAAILMQKKKGANATVTVCHSRTMDLAAITRMGDIVVAAIGSPKFITADMIKPGAVVIDVGTNRVDDPSAKKGYRWVGDVDFEAVKEKASAITPVPGGVGPMTIVMLMKNTVISACRANGLTY